MDADFLDELYGLNFRSYILCTGVAARHMRENIKGSIFFITSTRGSRAYAETAVYGGFKAGLKLACESIALELARFGIRCNAIEPGATAVHGDYDDLEMKMTRESGISSQIPLGRMGHPYEIGHAIAYLASEKAAYITGVSLRMDGGLILPGMPEMPDGSVKWSKDLDAFEKMLIERKWKSL